jgi:hypothetical protein
MLSKYSGQILVTRKQSTKPNKTTANRHGVIEPNSDRSNGKELSSLQNRGKPKNGKSVYPKPKAAEAKNNTNNY